MAITLAGIMDFAIIALLMATVYFAWRLNKNLKNFRQSRAELQGLISHLAANISHAEEAVSGMQNAAATSGARLQDIVNDAKFLADELRFMNEAGNGLAGRLEKLAEKNRELVEQIEKAGGVGPTPASYRAAEPAKAARPPLKGNDAAKGDSPVAAPAFTIRDRDADDEDPVADMDAPFLQPSGEPPVLQSQAERELYEALTKGRSAKTGGR